MSEKMSGTICLSCGKVWSSDSCRGRIRPRIKQNKSIRQMQKRYHHQPWQLKRWQRRLVKLSLKRSNRLEILCLYCRKTKQSRMPVPLEDPEVLQQGNPRKKKKLKKKKKDPCAGLIIPLKQVESTKSPGPSSAKRGRYSISPMSSALKSKPQSRTAQQMQQILDKQNKKGGKSMKASLKDFLDSVSQ